MAVDDGKEGGAAAAATVPAVPASWGNVSELSALSGGEGPADNKRGQDTPACDADAPPTKARKRQSGAAAKKAGGA